MEREELNNIIEQTPPNWTGDNAYKGLQILAKYKREVITGATMGIIYSVEINNIIKKLTKQDATKLAKLNWHIDKNLDCFACFV